MDFSLLGDLIRYGGGMGIGIFGFLISTSIVGLGIWMITWNLISLIGAKK